MFRAKATKPGKATKYVEMTASEIKERENEEKAYKHNVALSTRLAGVFDKLDKKNIPPAIRAHFILIKSAVESALNSSNPDIEAAKIIIENAKMPDGSDLPSNLEAMRTKLLKEFEDESDG